jgi:hypothetical protein
MRGEPASPRQRRGRLEGDALLGNPYDDEGHSRTVTRQPVHASPLGRAHIAPGQPWARLGAIGPSERQRARGRGT